MCGRFTLQIPPEILADIFGLTDIPTLPARYNIAPSQNVAVIRQNSDGQDRLDVLRWGLIPSWAKEKSIGNHMINARCETVAEKPAFRHAIKYHRCIIPASGFYEWMQEGESKTPMYAHLKDDSPICFAGLWDYWKSPEGEVVESCTILTTTSNKLMAPIHDRMPVILHPAEFALWLDREIIDPEDLIHLYRSYPSELMEIWPVSTQVNNPRVDAPELIRSVNNHPAVRDI